MQGNLTGVTQNGGTQTRSFGYDSLGRLSTAGNPESGTTCYGLLSGTTCMGYISGTPVGYDGNGNLLNRTDGRGIVTTMTYDALNRLTGKTYSDYASPNPTPWVTYSYQGTTDFLSLEYSNASGYTWSNYDALGRPGAGTQTTAGQSYAFSSLVWTPTGQVASITYPSGRVVTTSFDVAGRISGVGLNGNPTAYAGSTSYAAHGGLTSVAMGDGLTRSFGYNTRLRTGSVAAGSLLNLGLNWNANGTLGSQTIGRSGGFSATQSYTYDGVNRLTYVAESNGVQNWNQTYIYDNVGNRAVAATGTSGLARPSNYTPQTTLTASPPPGSSTNWPYNPATNQWAAPAATHDLAGNMIALRTQLMTFDAESRMVAWSDSSPSSSVAIAYDGDGRRVTKVSTAGTTVTTTTYVYDPAGNLAAEYGGSAPATTQTLYLTQDHLGSTRLVTTTGGVCVGAHDYLPFGEEIPQSLWGRGSVPCYGQTDTPVKFTGQERDNETGPGGSGQNGFDNYLARFMASGQGRFLSPDPANAGADPADPQSWNGYGYVANNPLANTDPDGTDEKPVYCDIYPADPHCDIFYNPLRQFDQLAVNALDVSAKIVNFINKPRDPGCMVQSEAKGAVVGTVTGGIAGGVGVLAGGVGEFVTVPTMAEGGALLGGAAGGIKGWFTCAVNNGPTAGGGGGGSTGNRGSRLRKLFGTEGPGATGNNPEQAARQALARLQETGQLPDGLTQSDLDYYRQVMERAAASSNPNEALQALRGQILNLAQQILGIR